MFLEATIHPHPWASFSLLPPPPLLPPHPRNGLQVWLSFLSEDFHCLPAHHTSCIRDTQGLSCPQRSLLPGPAIRLGPRPPQTSGSSGVSSCPPVLFPPPAPLAECALPDRPFLRARPPCPHHPGPSPEGESAQITVSSPERVLSFRPESPMEARGHLSPKVYRVAVSSEPRTWVDTRTPQG